MRGGRLLFIVLLLGAAALLYARHQANRALTADEAVSKGYVSVAVAYGRVPPASANVSPDSASPDNASPSSAPAPAPDTSLQSAVAGDVEHDGPNVVTVTFTRQSGAPNREITITLPVGSLIRNAAADGQRLITAAAVTVRLAPGSQSASVSVPTYCLDAFLLAPSNASALSLAATALVDNGQDLQPVRKLVKCLSSDQAFQTRQNALWLVSEGLFDMPYDQAREFLRAHWRAAMVEEVNAKIADRRLAFRQTIVSQHPGIADANIDEALALITVDSLTGQIEARAKTLAEAGAKDFLDAKQVLAGCGYKVDELAFFKAA